MKKILLVLIALTLSVTTALPATVGAQAPATPGNESITLAPVSKKYKIDAGQKIEDKISIVNDGQTDYDFVVYSRPYSVTNENYDPNFTNTPQNADAYGWVAFSKTRYRLAAGATIEVPYTLTVPKQAAPGGHYGVIFAETQPAGDQLGANSVVRKKRVGSLLYVTVNGSYTTSGSVETSDVPFWQLQPPLKAYTNVKNTGNSDFTDDTTFVVKDIFGNVKYQETKQYTILPQTNRKLTFEWKGASWFGFYKVELQQNVLEKKTEQSGYVLILPRYLPVLFAAVLLIGGAYAWFRHKKKK